MDHRTETRAVGVAGPDGAGGVREALAWLRRHGDGAAAPSAGLLRAFLTEELPRGGYAEDHALHEVAWALGDAYAAQGRPSLAALCRSTAVHELLSAGRWARSFTEAPAAFWAPALAALRADLVDRSPTRPGETTAPPAPVAPPRAALSLSSAHALLETVGDGLALTEDGQLPGAVVARLDDRFRWTEEFPWMRVRHEADLAPLRLLRGHLEAQRLLVHRPGPRGVVLARSERGLACTHDTARLWSAVVDPWPRWSQQFERDALGVMAASLLRTADVTVARLAEEMTHVLAGRWRAASATRRGSVFDGAATVAQAWYQLGVPLGWWDTGRGPADRRPNGLGRAAAVAVFGAVALRGPAGEPPG